MKLLVDMNLSPAWIDRLARHRFEAVHWSTIVSLHQEIYDESGNLRQIHRKSPVDLGHQEIGGDESRSPEKRLRGNWSTISSIDCHEPSSPIGRSTR